MKYMTLTIIIHFYVKESLFMKIFKQRVYFYIFFLIFFNDCRCLFCFFLNYFAKYKNDIFLLTLYLNNINTDIGNQIILTYI